MVHKDCRMQTSAAMSSTLRKKDLLPRRHCIIFPKGWAELNPARNQNLCHQRQVGVKLQLALRLMLLTILQLCHLPPPPHPRSVTLLACSLDASPYVPTVILYYCTFKVQYCKIKKCFLYFCGFFYVLFVKSIINLLWYSTI